ncbi:ferric reductase-like transmembrane domain-containing protein [Micromonospora sp. NPDC000212]
MLIEIMFVQYGAGKNLILTMSKFFALHAGLFTIFQLLLVARLPWLDRRLGMDRLTSWHRWLGFLLVWTVALHATLAVLGYAELAGSTPSQTFISLAGVPASLLGICAGTLFAVVAVLSVRPLRRRLRYEVWHLVHLTLYAALLLGIAHQLLETTTLRATTWYFAYWYSMLIIVVLALLVGRVIMPIWRNAYHRFRVAAVVPEGPGVVSIYIRGHRLDRLPAQAGQFMVWRFPDHNPWWQGNPFSLSAAPNGRSLRLTVKAVGDVSRRLQHVPLGTRVFAEGPYGAFTGRQKTASGTVLIAGGVGVTPIRALLEELTGPVTVLYRARSTSDAVLLPELRSLAQDRGAVLHLLTGRSGTDAPNHPPFSPDGLLVLVPDIIERDVFVCGPPAMTEAVVRSLHDLGLPRRQVHAERFGFA